MKAMLLTGHGGIDKLVYGDAPDPVAGPGDVVVDIHAASVNAADYKMRLGGAHYKTGGLAFPHILGRDFSGVVSAVGPGADLKTGDEVFGVTIPGTEGAYAEKIAIKAAIIAKKPAKLSHAEAAAMALTSLTAIWALEDTAKLKRGETVLIQGGAGGVAALQFGGVFQRPDRGEAGQGHRSRLGVAEFCRLLGDDRRLDRDLLGIGALGAGDRHPEHFVAGLEVRPRPNRAHHAREVAAEDV